MPAQLYVAGFTYCYGDIHKVSSKRPRRFLVPWRLKKGLGGSLFYKNEPPSISFLQASNIVFKRGVF